MNPKDLPSLAALLAVSRHGGFARAAVELEVSRSALSHSVRGLEERLGIRLLNRTTRSVSPTLAGERLLADLAPAMEQIDRAVDSVNEYRDHPSGRIRLNVPRLAAKLVLAPVIPSFMMAHPDIEIELAVDDAIVDIVAAGFDAGIRFGERIARDMIAVPISKPVEFAIVGSPAYIMSSPPVALPRDLLTHRCIRYRWRGSGGLFDWEFGKDGKAITVAVLGPLTLDAPELMIQAALDGLGLAYVSLSEVAPLIQEGRLSRVLEDWMPATERLYIYHPSRRQVPTALRALIDWLTSRQF
jgi:DNA-binding transcriptional LysR family regulator